MFKIICSYCGRLTKARTDKLPFALRENNKVTGYVCNKCIKKIQFKQLIKKYKIVENGIPFRQQLQTAIAES